MSIRLTPETEALIQQKVSSGLYPSAEAAVEAALRLLDDHDRRVARLRTALAAGEEGEALPWSFMLMEELHREAEAMYNRGETADPDVCP